MIDSDFNDLLIISENGGLMWLSLGEDQDEWRKKITPIDKPHIKVLTITTHSIYSFSSYELKALDQIIITLYFPQPNLTFKFNSSLRRNHKKWQSLKEGDTGQLIKTRYNYELKIDERKCDETAKKR
jgi:hypothetical protein